jgi:sugar lactone lactonase YvrE
MQFDAQGHLIVADAFRGLLSVAPDRTIAVLVEAVDGQRLHVSNALDIAADGTIWFSASPTASPSASGLYSNITSVREVDGVFWLGSLFGRAVGRSQAPPLP